MLEVSCSRHDAEDGAYLSRPSDLAQDLSHPYAHFVRGMRRSVVEQMGSEREPARDTT